MALNISSAPADATVKVEVVGSGKSMVKMSGKNQAVVRIENKDTQDVKITLIHPDEELSKTYNLSKMTYDDFPVSVTVSAEAQSQAVFGKNVSDLQSDVTVNETDITGTLKKVTGYTQFDSSPENQTGNYLALKIAKAPADATVRVESVGGATAVVKTTGATSVIRLEDKAAQDVKITVTRKTKSTSKVYDLSKMTFADA